MARSAKLKSPAIGQTLGGKFRIDAKLGEGGMGAVYKAWDESLGRAVALKVIKPELARDPSFIARFKREARAAAKVRHPAVIEIFDFDDGTRSPDNQVYMAFEFLDGARELSELIKNREVTPRQAVWILDQVLSALELAHQKGIVHRDLKPQNIMIEAGPELRAKILDFGIAKMKAADNNVSMNQITMAGQVMGTVYYMSPEQAEGAEIDGRTDLYACGVMLFLMLSGRLPFKSQKVIEIIDMHMRAPVPALGHPHLTIFDSVVQQAMAKRPADRFQTAAEFRDALASIPGISWTGTPRPAGSGPVQAIPPTNVSDHPSGRMGSALQHSAVNTPTSSYPTPSSAISSDPGSGNGYLPTPAGTPSGSGAAPAYNVGQTGEFFSGLIGKSIGKYVIEAKLGTGGMGAVFKARDKLLGREVAVKVVHPHLANDAAIRRRFLREARAALEFTHPNAIATRDCDITPDGLLYMTQDYSPGVSLRSVLERTGPLGVQRSLRLVRQALLALTEAHTKGIVHRDLKPENMLVEAGDRLQVCDFGIAKILDAGVDAGESLTAVGQVLGTPHYMAPEQAEGIEVTNRADLYAMGCVLYELLTGTKPFEAKSLRQIVLMHMGKAPDPMSERAPKEGIPPEVEALVLQAMAKDPAERISSAEAFIMSIDDLGYDTGGGSTRFSKSRLNDSDFETTIPPSQVTAPPSPLKGLAILLVIAVVCVGASFFGFTYVFQEPSAAELAKQEADKKAAADKAAADKAAADKKDALQREADAAAKKAADERAAQERRAAEAQAKRDAKLAAAKTKAERDRILEENRRAVEEATRAEAARDAAAEKARLELEAKKAELDKQLAEAAAAEAAAKERERELELERERERKKRAAEKLAREEEERRLAEKRAAEEELRQEDLRQREAARRKAEAERKAREAKRLRDERLARERQRAEEEAERAAAKANKNKHPYDGGFIDLMRVKDRMVTTPRGNKRFIRALRVTQTPVTYRLYTEWLESLPHGENKARRIAALTSGLIRPVASSQTRILRCVRPNLHNEPLPKIPLVFAHELADWLDLRLPTPEEAEAVASHIKSEAFFWDDDAGVNGFSGGRPRRVTQSIGGLKPILYLVKR